ncbi:MAG: hypothetical protein QOH69_1246 [Actinomycetota bacterium]|nr:hypothetical protein [Actinomycetota bacterium]
MRARLDYATGEIILPLDAYDVLDTWQDQNTIFRAQQIAVGTCMSSRGQTYTAAHVVDSPDSSVGDRQYGLWDVASAKKYGYTPPDSAIKTAIEAEAAAQGTAWHKAFDYCNAHLPSAIANLAPSNTEMTKSIVPRLATEAFNLASVDPGWQRARAKWWTCLRAAGLDPQTGADDWSSKQAQQLLTDVDSTGHLSDPENAIRVAFKEATCNDQTGLSQTLGNLEAAYQQPLIDQNQAALNKVKALKQQRLQTATEYIAKNG